MRTLLPKPFSQSANWTMPAAEPAFGAALSRSPRRGVKITSMFGTEALPGHESWNQFGLTPCMGFPLPRGTVWLTVVEMCDPDAHFESLLPTFLPGSASQSAHHIEVSVAAHHRPWP